MVSMSPMSVSSLQCLCNGVQSWYADRISRTKGVTKGPAKTRRFYCGWCMVKVEDFSEGKIGWETVNADLGLPGPLTKENTAFGFHFGLCVDVAVQTEIEGGTRVEPPLGAVLLKSRLEHTVWTIVWTLIQIQICVRFDSSHSTLFFSCFNLTLCTTRDFLRTANGTNCDTQCHKGTFQKAFLSFSRICFRCIRFWWRCYFFSFYFVATVYALWLQMMIVDNSW